MQKKLLNQPMMCNRTNKAGENTRSHKVLREEKGVLSNQTQKTEDGCARLEQPIKQPVIFTCLFLGERCKK